mmetsp:Transcript_24707/g.68206  ORF Transcript_24707/g.68206 Transcript_24707/m.68206 type:complete len:225 (-) Transcript_24707:102-776(-)
MKCCVLVGSIALLVLGNAAAFCPASSKQRTASPSVLRAAPELVPEPEGGEEISPVKTLTGSRMKNMGEAEGLTGVRSAEDAEGTINKYWLQATVEGKLIQELHRTVLKESAKKANFPGFRKGQVPPFAMPQIRGFAVQEAIVQTCQSSVDAYGLKSVSGSDGEVEVLEDIPEVAKAYKLGDDLQFTATFNAIVDPSLAPAPAAEDESDVVDVDVETEAEEVAAE